jgi:hypothetical protein
MQSPVAHVHIYRASVGLLVVGQVMLDTGRHIATLQTPDVGRCHLCRQVRIFAHVFEVSAAKRRTNNVHSGTQQNIFAPKTGLFAQNFTAQTGQIGIPGGSKRGSGGKISRGIVGPARVTPIVAIDFRSYSVRTVRKGQFGNTQPGDGPNVKFRITVQQAGFFFEAHFGDKRANLSFFLPRQLAGGIKSAVDVYEQQNQT